VPGKSKNEHRRGTLVKKQKDKSVTARLNLLYGVNGEDSSLDPVLAELQRLERDGFSSNRHQALTSCRSMMFSENRYPLFGIML
jgi:hypothetical protein